MKAVESENKIETKNQTKKPLPVLKSFKNPFASYLSLSFFFPLTYYI